MKRHRPRKATSRCAERPNHTRKSRESRCSSYSMGRLCSLTVSLASLSAPRSVQRRWTSPAPFSAGKRGLKGGDQGRAACYSKCGFYLTKKPFYRGFSRQATVGTDTLSRTIARRQSSPAISIATCAHDSRAATPPCVRNHTNWPHSSLLRTGKVPPHPIPAPSACRPVYPRTRNTTPLTG